MARRIVRFVAAEQNDSVRPGDSVAPFTGEEADTEIEPALLSLFCRGLNEQRKRLGKERFDQELVEGAKQGIIQDYYRSCLKGLPDRVGRFIETELITEKGHRNSFAREDAVPTHLSEDELDRLIKARLIRLEERYGTQRIELTHDLLTKAVRAHRDARRAEERLKEHEERERKLEAEAQIGRRFRALSALLAVALVAALAMTALAVYQKRQAESPARAYEALDLVLQQREVEKGLDRAIVAVETAETETALDALTRALAAVGRAQALGGATPPGLGPGRQSRRSTGGGGDAQGHRDLGRRHRAAARFGLRPGCRRPPLDARRRAPGARSSGRNRGPLGSHRPVGPAHGAVGPRRAARRPARPGPPTRRARAGDRHRRGAP